MVYIGINVINKINCINQYYNDTYLTKYNSHSYPQYDKNVSRDQEYEDKQSHPISPFKKHKFKIGLILAIFIVIIIAVFLSFMMIRKKKKGEEDQKKNINV